MTKRLQDSRLALQDSKRAVKIATRLRRAKEILNQAAVHARGDADQDCANTIEHALRHVQRALDLAGGEP